jgi:hypothetical protein
MLHHNGIPGRECMYEKDDIRHYLGGGGYETEQNVATSNVFL